MTQRYKTLFINILKITSFLSDEVRKQNSRLTRALLSDATGISESGIKKILASLKKYGLIKRIGSNKSGYWEVYN